MCVEDSNLLVTLPSMDIVNHEKVKNYIIKLRADIIINPTDNTLLCCRIDLNL